MPDRFDRRRLDTVQLVPPTPFTSDGRSVNPQPLADLVRRVCGAGISVLIPAAGTGEFHSLAAEEVLTCVRTTRSAASPGTGVIAPVGLGLVHALPLARSAHEAGADALLVMPPVHPYLSDSGFADYFEELRRATDLPILAYKRGPVPSDRLLGELGQAGKLTGVKYAVNEVDAVARFIDAYGTSLGVYCGTAERFAPFFHLAGATGYTSGAGNVCPRLTLALHAALARGDYPQAMKTLRTLRPIEDHRALEADSFNISLVKFALSETGLDFGPPRPPQRRLTEAEQQRIRQMLQGVLAAEAALA